MDFDTTCETLPRPPNSTGILLLKLKRKLQYKGHQYFESVRPQALKDALLYLKRNHIHYSDTEIQMQNISEELTNLQTFNEDSDESGSTSCASTSNIVENNDTTYDLCTRETDTENLQLAHQFENVTDIPDADVDDPLDKLSEYCTRQLPPVVFNKLSSICTCLFI